MNPAFAKYFAQYPQHVAPFMHRQLKEWAETKPLKGLRVLHHVPVVKNTLLKIACLVEAGAIVTVTNPDSVCNSDPEAVNCLKEAGITYAVTIEELKSERFDLYFDCGAELTQALGSPQIGAIELTGSGDQWYREHKMPFPVYSIDRTLTKQLETVLGCAQSCHTALEQLTGMNPTTQKWLVFGFGKIGRGLAYFCKQNNVPITVVDIDPQQRKLATDLGIKAINPSNTLELNEAIQESQIIITATGKPNVMGVYPREWFKGKTLANLGVYDEFGPNFSKADVLNEKKAINFILNDPTPMKFIDPEFYIHNLVALLLLMKPLAPGVYDMPEHLDEAIIKSWCDAHQFSSDEIKRWFISREFLMKQIAFNHPLWKTDDSAATTANPKPNSPTVS